MWEKGAGQPRVPPSGQRDLPCARRQARFSLAVLFTAPDATHAALRCAGAFSRGLNASIRLVALEVVPYPLDTSEPARSAAFCYRLLERIRAASGVRASIELYFCRDRKQAIQQLLSTSTVLIMGSAWRPWRTRELRLARWLTRNGYRVVLVRTVDHERTAGRQRRWGARLLARVASWFNLGATGKHV